MVIKHTYLGTCPLPFFVIVVVVVVRYNFLWCDKKNRVASCIRSKLQMNEHLISNEMYC